MLLPPSAMEVPQAPAAPAVSAQHFGNNIATKGSIAFQGIVYGDVSFPSESILCLPVYLMTWIS